MNPPPTNLEDDLRKDLRIIKNLTKTIHELQSNPRHPPHIFYLFNALTQAKQIILSLPEEFVEQPRIKRRIHKVYERFLITANQFIRAMR